ncbi:MAG: hypothetical protein ACW98X_11075 [Promethearchaeota archaeon]|jgi:hypothetical protein
MLLFGFLCNLSLCLTTHLENKEIEYKNNNSIELYKKELVFYTWWNRMTNFKKLQRLSEQNDILQSNNNIIKTYINCTKTIPDVKINKIKEFLDSTQEQTDGNITYYKNLEYKHKLRNRTIY